VIGGQNKLMMLRRDAALRNHQRLIPINAIRSVIDLTVSNYRAPKRLNKKQNKEVRRQDPAMSWDQGHGINAQKSDVQIILQSIFSAGLTDLQAQQKL
jgi:hypothetical protein